MLSLGFNGESIINNDHILDRSGCLGPNRKYKKKYMCLGLPDPT